LKLDAKKFKEYEDILNRPGVDGIDMANFLKIKPKGAGEHLVIKSEA
jgi:hypothetical protein